MPSLIEMQQSTLKGPMDSIKIISGRKTLSDVSVDGLKRTLFLLLCWLNVSRSGQEERNHVKRCWIRRHYIGSYVRLLDWVSLPHTLCKMSLCKMTSWAPNPPFTLTHTLPEQTLSLVLLLPNVTNLLFILQALKYSCWMSFCCIQGWDTDYLYEQTLGDKVQLSQTKMGDVRLEDMQYVKKCYKIRIK